MALRPIFPLLAVMLAPALAVAHPASAPLLPARQLACDLGHVSNYDSDHDQSADDLKIDSHHNLALFLPAIPVRIGAPPDPVDPPEPVDPRTRVTSDPSGLLAAAPGPFTRVVDLWPDRVELIKPMQDGKSWMLVMISHADTASHQAQILVAQAKDMFTYNKAAIYVGSCQVATP